MARSNSGGTRGWLRGKVANDLYQVTKTKEGRKVQLVRSVEESRVNNNTLEQALARMRMALLMGALSDMKAIVDHSWEGIPYGQLSIAHFVSVNMSPLTMDCKTNWGTDNSYCYPIKGVKQMRVGTFTIASGSLQTPQCIKLGAGYLSGSRYPFALHVGINDPTFGDIRAALGLNADDYITLLILDGFDSAAQGLLQQGFHFLRIFLSADVADNVQIEDDNVRDMFYYDGNTDFSVEWNGLSGDIVFRVATNPDGIYRDCLLSSVIVSRWDGQKWCRNNAKFGAADGSEAVNFENNSARLAFRSWFPSYDPDGDDSMEYPGKM